MTMQEKAERAALNNALWCETVCRTHGVPGQLGEAAWLNYQQTPPFYPCAVTVGGTDLAALQHNCIEQFVEARGAEVGGIKDSFNTLQLEPLGFRVLFEAQWIYKAAPQTTPTVDLAGVQWETVMTPEILSEWEQAWSGDSGVEGVFLPPLLDDYDVAIMAARREGQIVAGCIANHTSGVVGISNIFLPADAAPSLRHECVAIVHQLFDDLPIVGYESGTSLEAMLAIGFEAIGPLRVWLPERD